MGSMAEEVPYKIKQSGHSEDKAPIYCYQEKTIRQSKSPEFGMRIHAARRERRAGILHTVWTEPGTPKLGSLMFLVYAKRGR